PTGLGARLPRKTPECVVRKLFPVDLHWRRILEPDFGVRAIYDENVMFCSIGVFDLRHPPDLVVRECLQLLPLVLLRFKFSSLVVRHRRRSAVWIGNR